MTCPDESELQLALNDEASTSESRADVWIHVDACPSCQTRLAQLVDDVELRQWRDSAGFKNSHYIDLHQACSGWLRHYVAHDGRSSDTAKSFSTQCEPPSFSPADRDGDLGRLDRYHIVREIGRGGMARVYEAIDSQLGRAVAIKVLQGSSLDEASRQRFLREAKSIAAIHHPHVVTIYGAEAEGDRAPYIVMELINGPSLDARIRRAQGLSPRQAAEIVAQVADGLDAAHQAGLVHRDIKPSNILIAQIDNPVDNLVSARNKSVARNSDQLVPKLADFGLARPIDASTQITRTGILAGTPAYVSPEQVISPETCDKPSDIYSLGVTLFEVMTGVVPFRGAPHAVLMQIVQDDPPPPTRLNPRIPRDLETICLKAMARDPRARYESAGAFAADLRRWLNGESIQARPESATERLIRWSRRNPRVAGLLALVATLLVVIAAGSTAAAINIRKTNEQLQNEKSAANAAERDAIESATIAQRQRTLALDSLDALVSKVQQQLGTRPGTLKLREDILKSAFDGLERIVASADQRRVDHTTIAAHLRMGEILGALGRADESFKQYCAAEELAERALLDAPHDDTFLRDLADSLVHEGDVHHRGFAWENSSAAFSRAFEIRLGLSERSPEDAQLQHAVIVCKQRILDAANYSGKVDEAHGGFGTLFTTIEVLTRKFPNDRTLLRDYIVVGNRLGALCESRGQLDLADQHFRTSLDATTRLLEFDPDDPASKSDMAFVLGKIATLAAKRRDYSAADEMADRASQIYRQLAEADLDDTEAQVKRAGWAHSTCQIQLAQGHFASAHGQLEEALSVQIQLCNRHPTTCRFPLLAAETCYKLAELNLRMGRVAGAEHYFQESRRILDRCPGTVDFVATTTAGLKSVLDALIPAMELVREGSAAIETASSTRTAEKALARSIQMYQFALDGNGSAAGDLGDEIQKLQDLSSPIVFDIVQFLAARASAVCISRLRDSGGADAQSILARHNRLCSSLARSLIARSPATKVWFFSERDFEGVVGDLGIE